MVVQNFIGAQKLRIDAEGNPYMEEICDLKKNTKRVELDQLNPPLVKQLEAFVIIKRSFYDPTGKPQVWLGLQKLRFKIPNSYDYRLYYLVYKPKAMQSVCLTIINEDSLNRTTSALSMQRKKGMLEWQIIRPVGKPKELTANEAKVMLENKEVLGVFTDENLTEQQV